MTKQNHKRGRDLKINKDLPWYWQPDPIMDTRRTKRLVGVECLKELERRALLEIARGMFDCEISEDVELEVNEDIIEGIYFVMVTTETGRVLKFTALKSALDSLYEMFLERKSE